MIFNDILAKASSVQVNIVVSGSAHRLLDSVISFTQSYQASIEVTSCCNMDQCWMPATVTLQSFKSAVANCNPLDCNGFWSICHLYLMLGICKNDSAIGC